MLDAGLADLESGDVRARAPRSSRGRLELARDAARDLRELVRRPRAARAPASSASPRPPARSPAGSRLAHDVEIDLDVAHADELGENAAVAPLPDPPRGDSSRRCGAGRSTRIEIAVRPTPGGGVELVVADDGPPERRAAVLEALAERAATLNGRFSSEVRHPRGLTIRIDVPPAAAHR